MSIRPFALRATRFASPASGPRIHHICAYPQGKSYLSLKQNLASTSSIEGTSELSKLNTIWERIHKIELEITSMKAQATPDISNKYQSWKYFNKSAEYSGLYPKWITHIGTAATLVIIEGCILLHYNNYATHKGECIKLRIGSILRNFNMNMDERFSSFESMMDQRFKKLESLIDKSATCSNRPVVV
ncbi:hypothetical protein HOY82DRAFT_534784 [Tuber indicum]|nr:hypothetical protein HOY82DRAFT_534784 [Tuber indicum]